MQNENARDISSGNKRLLIRAEVPVVSKRLLRDEVKFSRNAVSETVVRDFVRLSESIAITVNELSEPRTTDDVSVEAQVVDFNISSERLEVSKCVVVSEELTVSRRTVAAVHTVSLELRREAVVGEKGDEE